MTPMPDSPEPLSADGCAHVCGFSDGQHHLGVLGHRFERPTVDQLREAAQAVVARVDSIDPYWDPERVPEIAALRAALALPAVPPEGLRERVWAAQHDTSCSEGTPHEWTAHLPWDSPEDEADAIREADAIIAAIGAAVPPEGLREAAQAVVAAWVDDESGMATFDPEVIDDLRRALDADEFARTAALSGDTAGGEG